MLKKGDLIEYTYRNKEEFGKGIIDEIFDEFIFLIKDSKDVQVIPLVLFFNEVEVSKLC